MELEFHVKYSSSWNPSSRIFFFFFLNFSDCYNSIVQKSSFKLKLDFLKIEFQNRGISLISLGRGAKC